MFQSLIFLLIVQHAVSDDVQLLPVSGQSLITKLLELVDQLLVQVRKMQALINRAYSVMDQVPDELHSFYAVCFTEARNASKIRYLDNLNEAAIHRLPQLRAQLEQATTLEQQLQMMNITDRTMTEVTYNIAKPSLLFVTEILNCLKDKFPMNNA